MRGAIIDEITSLSGARIDIMKKDARGERRISISGSTHTVTMAKSLITIALTLELGRNRGIDNIMEHESK